MGQATDVCQKIVSSARRIVRIIISSGFGLRGPEDKADLGDVFIWIKCLLKENMTIKGWKNHCWTLGGL